VISALQLCQPSQHRDSEDKEEMKQIKEYANKIMPIESSLWPVMTQRLKEGDEYLSCLTLCTFRSILSLHGDNFFRQVEKDLWPALRNIVGSCVTTIAIHRHSQPINSLKSSPLFRCLMFDLSLSFSLSFC